MKLSLKFYKIILPTIVLSLLTSCKNDNEHLSPLSESYQLMDGGENAKAVTLLESELINNQSNNEAEFLLATAYVGSTGLDIYSLYDSFSDILFSESITDYLFSEQTSSTTPIDDMISSTDGSESLSKAPIDQIIIALDRFFNIARRVLFFLNRLPNVADDKLPLLQAGIDELDSITPENEKEEKEIRLYRLFVRLIVIREALRTVTGDESFGSKKWACQVNLFDLHDGLLHLISHCDKAIHDFRKLYPERASSLTELTSATNGLKNMLDTLWEDLPAGVSSTSLFVEERAKALGGCNE